MRKKLNAPIFMFGLELIFRPKKIYFDSGNLYVVKRGETKTYPLETITQLRRTNTKINGSARWSIRIHFNGSYHEYGFIPKNSLWDDTFSEFRHLLATKFPEVEISKTSWF